MALPDTFQPVFLETEDTIRERLLASVPEPDSTVEGAWRRDWVEINVGELSRLWDMLNTYLSYSFVRYATGPLLDAHGENYGVPRDPATYATGQVRFYGEAGILIPPATVVSAPELDPDVERAIYATTNTSAVAITAAGYVSVDVVATVIGTTGNKGPGAVTLIETPGLDPGIDHVTNLTPLSGGQEVEDDPSYRSKLLTAAALPQGSGTVLDYIMWGTDRPGVAEVAVDPLWDRTGNSPGQGTNFGGTVRLSLRGDDFTPVDWAVVEDVQRFIDPSRQAIALLEQGEPWLVDGVAAITWPTADVQTGYTALNIAEPSTTTTGSHSAGATTLNVGSTAGFPDAGNLYVGTQALTYTGITGTTFTGIPATGPGSIGSTISASTLVLYGDATTHGFSAAFLQLPMNLQRFDQADDFLLWIKAADWAKVSDTSAIRFYTDDANYFTIPFSLTKVGGDAKPSSGSAWWGYRFEKHQLTATGAPDWSAITEVEIRQQVTSGTSATYDHFTAISDTGATGEGKAPVGAAVTVVTPVPKPIDVVAAVDLDPNYTLGGAAGTADATELIRSMLEAYLRSLAPGTPVRISRLGNAIGDAPGINDYVLRSPGATTVVRGNQSPLPQANIDVESTAGFLAAGTIFIEGSRVAYTGMDADTFQGGSGGSGALTDNMVVRQLEIPVTLNEYAVLGTLTLSQA